MTPGSRVHIPDFGEPAPLFTAATDGIDAYNIGVAGGRWVVLMVFGSLAVEACRQAHALVLSRRALFDDANACFFGISGDPGDRSVRALRNQTPGLRYFWDFDHAVSRLYGLNDGVNLRPAVFLIDPALRIAMAEPIEATAAVLDRLQSELAAARGPAEPPFAPVLALPRIFEPELCEALIAYFNRSGGEESGFSANVHGRTVQQIDPQLKRRRDVLIEDETLRAAARSRMQERLFPMVKRAWGWEATEIERDLVACYDAADGGFFSAHRDDATAGTAHRRFAVTINLNAEDHEGGELRFPEFGPRLYRPPTGGAVVFGCGLLHEARPVTRGVRYAFVPFLYDEAGARLRRANLRLVEGQPRTGQPNREARRAGRR